MQESGRVKPLSAVCGICSEEQGKDTTADTKTAEGMCGAMFQMISKSSEFAGFQSLSGGLVLTINARVESQAGERVGADHGVRLGSQRPEMPTAREFFGFGNGLHYGAVNHPLALRYGAERPKIWGASPIICGAGAGASASF